MSNPESGYRKTPQKKEKKIPHGWTKDTLGKCAIRRSDSTLPVVRYSSYVWL